MENLSSFWQLGDELRGLQVSDEHKWSLAASKLAEQTRPKVGRRNNLDLYKGSTETSPRENLALQEDNRYGSLNLNMLNMEMKLNESIAKSSMGNGMYNMNTAYQKNNLNSIGNMNVAKYNVNNNKKDSMNGGNHSNNFENANSNNAVDKRFKTLPAAETLPRNEILGGYIFVCNNDTMQEDLKRQLFGLPPRYRDSVRAITPGLPLFLYNYTTHQLHGIFEASGFGGSNIDATAWEDKKCKGESRFPAQVRIRIRKICKALEEDAFRPVLHHYDGPKFRLELSVPETLDLLDLCEQAGVV